MRVVKPTLEERASKAAGVYYTNRDNEIERVCMEEQKKGRVIKLFMLDSKGLNQIRLNSLIEVYYRGLKPNKAIFAMLLSLVGSITWYEIGLMHYLQPNQNDLKKGDPQTIEFMRENIKLFWDIEKNFLRLPSKLFVYRLSIAQIRQAYRQTIGEIKCMKVLVSQQYKYLLGLDIEVDVKQGVEAICAEHLSRIDVSNMKKGVMDIFKHYNELIQCNGVSRLSTIVEESRQV